MNKHKTFMRILLILVINIVIAVSVGSFFFGKKDFSSEQKENGRLIGASYMTMNNEFYKIISEEVSYRIEAEGDRLILRDPALNPERQAEQIEDMLDMGISALIVAPADSECLREVLKKAREQGVSVLRNVTESEQTLERLLSDSGSGNFRLDTLSVAVENAVSYPGFDGYQEAMQEVENAVSQSLVNEENISTGQIIYNRKLNTFLKDRNE